MPVQRTHDHVTTHPEYARLYHLYLSQGQSSDDAARLAYAHTQQAYPTPQIYPLQGLTPRRRRGWGFWIAVTALALPVLLAAVTWLLLSEETQARIAGSPRAGAVSWTDVTAQYRAVTLANPTIKGNRQWEPTAEHVVKVEVSPSRQYRVYMDMRSDDLQRKLPGVLMDPGVGACMTVQFWDSKPEGIAVYGSDGALATEALGSPGCATTSDRRGPGHVSDGGDWPAEDQAADGDQQSARDRQRQYPAAAIVQIEHYSEIAPDVKAAWGSQPPVALTGIGEDGATFCQDR